MTVVEAYRHSWAQRRFVIPLFIMIRVFSAGVIVPIIVLLVPLALSLSGQAALTDQDIAAFFVSPAGFLVFLGIASILLMGSVIGLAAMTLKIRQGPSSGLTSLRRTLALMSVRLRAIITYAVRLVLRVLIIVGPFALAALAVAWALIGQYDINFYLSSRPPEFLVAMGLIGIIVLVMAVVLLSRLLRWAVSLHLVIFDKVAPGDCFGQSAELMEGQRLNLLKAILLWLAVRMALIVGVGIILGWLMSLTVENIGVAFRIKLALALGIALFWGLCNLLISAIALGALARILNGCFGGARAPDVVPEITGGQLLTLRTLGAGAVALTLFGLIAGAVMIQRVQAETSVEIIAHRGAAGMRPENTLASIRQAVEDGADWVEIDVQETADGQVVVMHDSDFMKLAGVDLRIWEATLDDLSRIDIGSWFDPIYADQRTPLLEDVLEIVRDKSNLLIELKYYGHDVDLEARTIATVEAAGMADQVATMSLKYPAVQKMKELKPDWTAGVLAATSIGDLARLDADFIAVSTAMVSPRLIRAAHHNNKKLYVWTVNDPFQMSAMISKGVDGLITDEPALARRVIDIRAELSTPERIFLMFAENFGLSISEQRYRDNSS